MISTLRKAMHRAETSAPVAANDEPTLDDLEHNLAVAMAQLGDAQAEVEAREAALRQAENAFVARAGRLLYNFAIVPRPAEEEP